ncbi:MAG: methyltransferase [Pseudomonadota bacterium]
MKSMSMLFSAGAAIVLAACQTVAPKDQPEGLSADAVAALDAALQAQTDEAKARYGARNPSETIAFFEIEPGMTVVEALPGGGWYSKILIPYLGPEGELIAAHYPDALWPALFGENADPERVAGFIARADGWAEGAREWYGDEGASVQQYKMTDGQVAENAGTVDAVLFIRALHNLNRTESEMGVMSGALEEAFMLLKPGGVIGVVQHRGPEGNSDEWAVGNAGYLKQSDVIATFEAAGFELDATSEINANPLDVPSNEDIVWRLKPSLGTTEEGTPERAALEAIGESDRMTLRFRKPV